MKRMAKHISAMCLAAVALAAPAPATAYSFMQGGIAYEVSGSRAIVTSTSSGTDNYSGLLQVRVPATTTHGGVTYRVSMINDRAFMNCASLRFVKVLDGITRLGSQTFASCPLLTCVTIPTGVNELGYALFDGCTSLENVDIPLSVQSIDTYCFRDCHSLTQVTVPSTVLNIQNGAFKNCLALEDVALGDGFSILRTETFAGCVALRSIDIPNGVLKVEERAFDGCTSLQTVWIGSQVDSIHTFAFSGCIGMEHFEVDWRNTNYSSRDGVLYNASRQELVRYPIGRSDTHYTVPYRVKNLREYALSGCVHLEQLGFENGLQVVGDYAISQCNKLAEVDFPLSLIAVGNGAMKDCPALRHVLFEAGVKRLGSRIFEGCPALSDVHMRSRRPDTLSIALDAFEGVPAKARLYVPPGTVPLYEQMACFAPFGKIIEEGRELEGDVNRDEVVNGADVTALYNYLLYENDNEDDGEEDRTSYDVNHDGIINGSDITSLYGILLEK